jgi:hypothetical protein
VRHGGARRPADLGIVGGSAVSSSSSGCGHLLAAALHVTVGCGGQPAAARSSGSRPVSTCRAEQSNVLLCMQRGAGLQQQHSKQATAGSGSSGCMQLGPCGHHEGPSSKAAGALPAPGLLAVHLQPVMAAALERGGGQGHRLAIVTAGYPGSVSASPCLSWSKAVTRWLAEGGALTACACAWAAGGPLCRGMCVVRPPHGMIISAGAVPCALVHGAAPCNMVLMLKGLVQMLAPYHTVHPAGMQCCTSLSASLSAVPWIRCCTCPALLLSCGAPFASTSSKHVQTPTRPCGVGT